MLLLSFFRLLQFFIKTQLSLKDSVFISCHHFCKFLCIVYFWFRRVNIFFVIIIVLMLVSRLLIIIFSPMFTIIFGMSLLSMQIKLLNFSRSELFLTLFQLLTYSMLFSFIVRYLSVVMRLSFDILLGLLFFWRTLSQSGYIWQLLP